MIKIMFVCHGNICRSPMAEFVMKEIVARNELQNSFQIASTATSYEEIGNDIHYGTKSKLREKNISFEKHSATRFTVDDYKNYDYIVVMDDNNIRNLQRIIGEDIDNKVYKLMDFCGGGNVADPWYTGDFDTTYKDILDGCTALLDYLKKEAIQ